MNEVGLMDIGKHCHYCRELDFLPFTCSECGFSFCKEHRVPGKHNCESEVKTSSSNSGNGSSSGAAGSKGKPSGKGSVAALFEEAKGPKSYEMDRKLGTSPNGTIPNSLSVFLQGNNETLGKLKSFIAKSQKSGATVKRKILNKDKITLKNNKTMVNVSRLKQVAVSSDKVPASFRVHLWVWKSLVVQQDSVQGVTEFSINANDGDLKGVYVSSQWPVGKALDSLTSTLKIKNDNRKTTNESERIHLYKSDDSGHLVKLSFSGRVNKELADGDVVFLGKF